MDLFRVRPFSLDEARAAGISATMLRGKSWQRIGSRLYRSIDAANDHWALISALHRMLPDTAVFVGLTAAWIHGLGVDPASPVEVALPRDNHLRSRAGLEVRHSNVADEAVTIKGVPATNLSRTLLDLCAHLPPVEALAALDMARHAGFTDKETLRHYANGAKHRRGLARLRSLAELMEPAESPMETRLRWLLIKAKLPVPEVQSNLHDREGGFVGRADLYYRSANLVVEFDGGNHRDRLVSDDRRQNALVNAGYRILRFTAADVHGRPNAVVAQVAAAYRSGR